MPRAEIVKSVAWILGAGNVVTDTARLKRVWKLWNAGADFADGVIDYEGRWLGGDTFVSFDKKAVAAIAKQGAQTKLLA